MFKPTATLAALALLLPAAARAADPAPTRPAAAATRALTPADAVEWRQRAVADISRIDSADGRVRAALLLSRMGPVLREGEARAALANLIRSDLDHASDDVAASAREYLAGRGPATRRSRPTVDSIVADLREKKGAAIGSVGSGLYNATGDRPLNDADFARITDALEAAAGSGGEDRWPALAETYATLSAIAARHERPDRARRLLDRMVEVLLAHPALRTSGGGTNDGPEASTVAGLLYDAIRDDDLNRLAAALPPADRRQLLLHWVIQPLWDGDCAEGSKQIERHMEGDAKDAELTAVAGVLRRALGGTPPTEAEMKAAESEIDLDYAVGAAAHTFAADGDVETAERLLIRPDSGGSLQHRTLANLASVAAGGGHAEVARREMRKAWEWYQKHPKPGTTETQWLAIAALDAHADSVAADILAYDDTFWLVEPEVALARRKRLAGDADAARRLLHDAAARAETTPTGDGGPARFLAKVAGEHAALGDDLMAGRLIARAAELNEKMNDTFFFAPGGYAAIIGTCADLGRPDLIQRGYDALIRPADRALYAAIAAQAAYAAHRR